MSLLSPTLYDQPYTDEEETKQPASDPSNTLTLVCSAFEACKRNQEGLETLWANLWRLWRFYKAADGAVKVFDPIGFAMSVGILSKIFVRPPRVVLTSRNGGWRWLAKIMQSYLEYQFANPDSDEPMEEEFISFVTEMLVLGTAVGKTSWCTKYITQFEDQQTQDPMTGEVSMQRVPIQKKAYDDPIFEHIPLEHFFLQPGAKNISEAKYVIFEKFVDASYLEYLKELVDEGTGEPMCNVEALEEAIAQGGSEQTEINRNNIEDARKSPEGAQQAEARMNRYHLMEYWENDRYVLILDKRWVIRDEDNPNDDGKKPFVAMSYVKVPHEFWGIGAIEPIADLQKVQNITLTQRLEFVSNLLNQQFSVLTGAQVDEDALMDGYPVVHMNTHDAVRPLDKGSVPQASFITAQDINASVERTSGISGYQLGAPAAASDNTQGTKGGIDTIVSEAQTRFDQVMRRFENIVVKGVAQRFLDLDRQYFPSFESKLMLVTEGQEQVPVPINRELINAAQYYISIVPGSTGIIDQQKKLNTFMGWAEFAMNTIPNFNREMAVMEAAELQDIERPERFIAPMAPVTNPQTGAPVLDPMTGQPVTAPNGEMANPPDPAMAQQP